MRYIRKSDIEGKSATGAVEVLHMLGAITKLPPLLSSPASIRIRHHLAQHHELQQPVVQPVVFLIRYNFMYVS